MSYATPDNADDRAIATGNTTWQSLLTGTKQIHLNNAHEYLDQTYTFKGWITDDAQADAWPREGVYDKEGRYLDPDTVPDAIKNAEIELAFILAAGGSLTENISERSISKVKAGSVEVTFDGATRVTEAQRMKNVDRLLVGLIEERIGGGSGPRKRLWA